MTVFNIVDLVQLLSPGPIMTVSFLSTDGMTVFCEWFAPNGSGQHFKDFFPNELLKPAVTPP